MSSSDKVKPGPAYLPLKNKCEDLCEDGSPKPVGAPQLQATFVTQQPMMVMYTSGLPLGPAPVVQFASLPTPVPFVVKPPQKIVTPNTHLVLTFVMFFILTVLAPETLIFMIPALILAIMGNNAVTRGEYGRAKKLGRSALALNFIGLISAFVVAIVCVSLAISLNPWRRFCGYYDDVYYGCFYDYNFGYWGSGDYGSGVLVDPPLICY